VGNLVWAGNAAEVRRQSAFLYRLRHNLQPTQRSAPSLTRYTTVTGWMVGYACMRYRQLTREYMLMPMPCRRSTVYTSPPFPLRIVAPSLIMYRRREPLKPHAPRRPSRPSRERPRLVARLWL
jgi:hypothetical protein